ncbi:MAG: SRPBCC family protein [Acidimicrobiales bacterium]
MEGSEQRLVRRTVDASIEQCVRVAVDIPSYPRWAEGVQEAVVTDIGGDGLVKKARFVAAAHGRVVTYELEYSTQHLPHSLSWTLVRGDIVQMLSGSYGFAPSLDEPDQTDVIYQLEVALFVPVPGFVRRRAEDILMSNALERFSGEVARRAQIGQ